jgi:hypothetical protein
MAPIPNLAQLGTVKLRPTNSVKSQAPRETPDRTEEPPWAHSTLRKRPPPQIPVPSGERSPIPKPRIPRAPVSDHETEAAPSQNQRKTPKLPPSRGRPQLPAVPNITSSNGVENDTQVDGRKSSGMRHRNLPPPPMSPSIHNEQNGGVKPSTLANRRLPPVPTGDTNPGGGNNTGHSLPAKLKPAMAPKPNLAPKPRVPTKPKLPPR